MKEFGKCFAGADQVVLLPIYPAGEKPIRGVSSDKIVPLLKKNKIEAVFLNGSGINVLKSQLTPDSVFLTLGAGDVWKLGQKLFAE